MRHGKKTLLADMNEALSLEFFLTNRCNMDCSYCSSREIIHEKDAKKLTFEQLKQAVDSISADQYVHDKYDGKVHVDFTGGEPLLEYDLMKEIVDYTRKNIKGTDWAFELETNGTLLTESRIDWLIRNDIDIRLSLDGDKNINDRHRRFRQWERFRGRAKAPAEREPSVFDSILRKMQKGLLRTKHMDRVLVGAILDSTTMHRLPDVMRFFKDGIGFKRMEIGPQAYEIWDQAGMERLKKILRSLTPWFVETLEYKMGFENRENAFHELQFTQSKSIGTEFEDVTRKTLTLFYDGYYYLCDFVVTPPLDKKFRVGDVRNGIDFKRIEEITSSSLFGMIARRCEHRSGFFSPVEGYYWGLVHDYGKAGLDEVLENTSEMNKVFNDEMEKHVKLQRLFQQLIMTPSFGDFAHDPKNKSGKEIKSLRLAMHHDSEMPGLREDIDYGLYSPGDRKELVLDAMDSLRQSIDVMEGMAIYAVMKARFLNKRLRVMVKIHASALEEKHWRFFSQHGIQVAMKESSRGG